MEAPSEPEKRPDASLLLECPVELPSPKVDFPEESIWTQLSGQDKVNYIIKEVGLEWARVYHTCAIRHEGLVDFLELE